MVIMDGFGYLIDGYLFSYYYDNYDSHLSICVKKMAFIDDYHTHVSILRITYTQCAKNPHDNICPFGVYDICYAPMTGVM
jgi:hypothetical protein